MFFELEFLRTVGELLK